MKIRIIFMTFMFLFIIVNLSSVNANSNQYTYTDRTIDLNLEQKSKDHGREYYLEGNHLVWIEGYEDAHVYYKHLPSGEVQRSLYILKVIKMN